MTGVSGDEREGELDNLFGGETGMGLLEVTTTDVESDVGVVVYLMERGV